MEDNLSASDDELLKVIRVDVLTASPDIFSPEEAPVGKHYAEIPLLNFELENGENFLMTSIPVSIAIEIAKKLNGVESADSRLTVAELVPELCVVERVIIDSVVPYSTAYQASIEVRLEGVNEIQRFQMVPSHATLLSLVAGSQIYISKSVVSTDLDSME